jgi:HCOMODA/2-hydroxy-3-carboxy-muconic semialdehyde decarboxylase
LSYIRGSVAREQKGDEGAIRRLREDVATANRIAHAAGLVTAFGHVSARIPGTGTFVIPTRSSPLLATPARLLVMSCDGDVLHGEGQPNSEAWIHARLYAARPDVGGVAHVHPPSCVALAQLGLTVRPLHNSGAVAGEVPVFERPGLITSRELGDAAAAALGGGRALLLRGHGANVAESDVRRAVVVACFLEEAACLQLQALAAAGGDEDRLRCFLPDEAARVRAEIEATGPMARAWDYYSRLADIRSPRSG